MTMSESNALARFPEDIQEEYRSLLHKNRGEIHSVQGSTTILEMLLERYTFIYAALRTMERDWVLLDAARYNQLLGLWIKIGAELIGKYKDIYDKGALQDIFIKKVMSSVSEEVADPEVLKRIRERLAAAVSEDLARKK